MGCSSSRFGCLGWKVTIFTHPGIVQYRAKKKKNYKKCPDTDQTEISLRGQFKLEPHTHLSRFGI